MKRDGELNPNHPMTEGMRGQWHKIVALIMFKQNTTKITITFEQLRRFAESNLGAVTIKEKDGALHLELVSWEEGERLAREEGGLPA